MSSEPADFEGRYGEAAQCGSLELVAEYEPDEENEARILLMILGLLPAKIDRIVEELRLVSPNEM